jgi:Protein of unknown function (DUF4058)
VVWRSRPRGHRARPLDGDNDAWLDLQAIFTTVYDRAGYDYSLDYRRPVEPPLSDAEAAWVSQWVGVD